MKRYKLRQLKIGFTLAVLFLNACGAPFTIPSTTAPTLIPPSVTHTAIPTATHTPVPPTVTHTAVPTATPTAVPTATHTPVPPTETLDPAMGRIQGRVYRTDIDLPFVDITIKLFSSGLEVAETTTDVDGRYSFPQVQPGNYRLRIELGVKHLATCKTAAFKCDVCYAVYESYPGKAWSLTGVEFVGGPGHEEFNVSAGQILVKDLLVDCID